MLLTIQFGEEAVLPNQACLFVRSDMPVPGGIEDTFLAGGVVRAHEGRDFVGVLERLSAVAESQYLLVSRNPKIVLDHSLASRISTALKRLEQLKGKLVVASAGGLTQGGRVLCSSYSSTEPFIMASRDIYPIVDIMSDLYLIDVAALKALFPILRESDTGFELGLVICGYSELGKASVYVPELCAAINGPLVARDLVKLQDDLARLDITQAAAPFIVSSLMGPIEIAGGRARPQERTGIRTRTITDMVEAAIEPLRAAVTVSVVIRTRFGRPVLLRRLLTSIERATINGIDVEVVLSSDAPSGEILAARVAKDFPRLRFGHAQNLPSQHSRIQNLVEGIKASTGDYVWLMDDDDYIDIFAFQKIRSATFANARPLLVGTSVVHQERWELLETEHPVLSSSVETARFPSSGWRKIFGGVNHMPICAGIVPRGFMIEALNGMQLDFDLSEDYALYLRLFSMPTLPDVVEIADPIAHISIRPDQKDNTVLMPDRTRWTRDITGYLFSLVHSNAPSTSGIWQLLSNAHASDVSKDAVISRQSEALRAQTKKINRLYAEIERLQVVASEIDIEARGYRASMNEAVALTDQLRRVTEAQNISVLRSVEEAVDLQDADPLKGIDLSSVSDA